ncbi:hypothetical protein [Epilithonimonas xixisoli]|uniref:Uncharacterized protein n=1 Tax=Epilithonimonas xixisoli TaxID=1476462 RepID=A0A4R8IHU8_9FLAO|nr:hypothetical protein [Epilithonimonas xixisoli]TDX86089.1 hypothetical protein B0I22_0195 [Epilithonimonas xixisoli]
MITKLKKEFEDLYFREISTVKGLENLSGKIPIAKNTLRRFLGKMKSESNLSVHSLNTISKFLNYKNFEDFKNQQEKNPISILDLGTKQFYDFLKERKPKNELESVFQNINIQNAERIINNPDLLRLFFLEYRDSADVLEYVLGWHPTYHRSADSDYQDVLLNVASHTKISHFGVFANSFVILGKFFSEDNPDFEKHFKDLEKSYQKMKKEFGNQYIFPVARFSVAKLFVLHAQDSEDLRDFINEQIQLPINENLDELQTIVFKVHFADALNKIGKYEDSFALMNDYNEDDFDEIWTKYYHEKYKYLFIVTKIMTLLGLGKTKEAKQYFDDFKIDWKDRHLTFDIASYIKLQYFTLGYFLDKINSENYLKNLKNEIEITGFKRWNSIFERLKC